MSAGYFHVGMSRKLYLSSWKNSPRELEEVLGVLSADALSAVLFCAAAPAVFAVLAGESLTASRNSGRVRVGQTSAWLVERSRSPR
ncbi:hypothetical protein LC724_21815 [Blautia sp. RD014234]|nr:hypothetical protein [Blautia parvula]